MPEITFYRQRRRDGGTRTGIDIDGNSALDRFEAGTDDPDPALVWYVDVRCVGPSLPRTSHRARMWLLQHEVALTGVVLALAHELEAGSDPSDLPLRKTSRIGKPPVAVTVACSAVRRLEAK